MAKDAYWFPHDANARHDPRIVRLRMKHGLSGVGFFWCCIEFLREQSGYRATREEFEAVEYETNADKEIMKTLIDLGLLVLDGELLFSESLIDRMSLWDSRRRAGAIGGKNSGIARKDKFASKQKGSKVDFASKQKSSRVEVITEQNRTEQNRINRTEQREQNTVTSHLKVAATKKPNEKSKSGDTWEAYRTAYIKRYGVEPVRNKQVNSVLCRIVDAIGAENAPKVAQYYLTSNAQWYMTKGHCVQSLLSDAQKLLTEAQTGNRLSTYQAREADRLQGVGEAWERVIAEKCDKE